MKEVSLFGKYSHLKCKLDDEWAKMIEDGCLKLLYQKSSGYVIITESGLKDTKIHQLVMDFKQRNSNTKKVIDHIDNDKLNNTSSNLRVVDSIENSGFSNRKIQSTNKTGVRGVHFCKKSGFYICQMVRNYKNIYYKRTKDKDDAFLIGEFNNKIRDL